MGHQFSRIYELSRVFIGNVNGKKKFLYSVCEGSKYELIPESHVSIGTARTCVALDQNDIFDKSEVQIICSFIELAKKEGIESLLLNSKHQYISKISRSKIQLVKNAIANKRKKFASSLDKLNNLAIFTTNIICDELGFNVAVHPMTTFIDPSKVQNVAVPATKVEKFKEELAKYIYALFLTEQGETIFHDCKERSSCIEGSLHFSHIELTRELLHNEVSVQPDLRTGTVSVRKELLRPEFVQEPTEFQKVHILSVK